MGVDGMAQDELLYDVTYRHIRNDIMHLTLEPGAGLSVRKLAEMYKVSRTPAQEAVIRLQKEDLVRAYPQSRTIVSKISISRVQAEQFIRKTLEIASVDDFIVHSSPLVTDALEYIISQQQKLTHTQNHTEFFESDNKFHNLIFETADKGLAWSIVNLASSHYYRFRFLSIKIRGLNERIVDEHKQILRAAKRGDAAAMKQAIADHVDYIQREYEELTAMYPQYFASK